MPIDNKLIDNLLKDYKTPEEILGDNGLLKQLTKAVLERAMQAELTEHLGYEPHEAAGDNSGNSRNGKSRKTLKGEFGNLPLEVPRDRNSSFEPQIVPKVANILLAKISGNAILRQYGGLYCIGVDVSMR